MTKDKAIRIRVTEIGVWTKHGNPAKFREVPVGTIKKFEDGVVPACYHGRYEIIDAAGNAITNDEEDEPKKAVANKK